MRRLDEGRGRQAMGRCAGARPRLAVLALLANFADAVRVGAPSAGGSQASNSSADHEFELAAAGLMKLPEFRDARFVRVDRDATQLYSRLIALRAGKVLLVPPPGLLTGKLAMLDPFKIDPDEYHFAVTFAGVKMFGEPVEPSASTRVDLVVFGASVVDPTTGARKGKTGSYSDFDDQVLRRSGALHEGTRFVAVVRDASVADLPKSADAFRTDVVCTPTRTLHIAPVARLATTTEPWLMAPDGARELDMAQLITDARPSGADSKKQMRRNVHKRLRNIARSAGPRLEEEFDRAGAAVELLPEFQRAKVVHVNLHKRVAKLRIAVLKAGKRLLVGEKYVCSFRLLDPARIDPHWYAFAVTKPGLRWFGDVVDADANIKVDLFVIGSLVANPSSGGRVPPPRSLDDLAYCALRQMGAVDESTPVVTALGKRYLMKNLSSNDMELHTVPVDVICTASRTIRVEAAGFRKPKGLFWRDVTADMMRRAPLLRDLKARTEWKAHRAIGNYGGWKRAARIRLRRHIGSKTAVACIQGLPEFHRAKVVLVDAGAAQLHIRVATLRRRKILIVPLANKFVLLDPSMIDAERTINAVRGPLGFAEFGISLDERELPRVGLIVIGSASVDPSTGMRRGVVQESAASDWDCLMASFVRMGVPVATPVEEHALVSDIPMDFDPCPGIMADIVCTPGGALRVKRPPLQPPSVTSDLLNGALSPLFLGGV